MLQMQDLFTRLLLQIISMTKLLIIRLPEQLIREAQLLWVATHLSSQTFVQHLPTQHRQLVLDLLSKLQPMELLSNSLVM